MIAAIRAEVVKLLTTRLPMWLLAAAAALAALLVFVTVPTGHAGAGDALTLNDPDLLARVSGVGVGGAEVLMLVLGVLAFTQDLRFGTITPTLLATPSRPRLVLAKMAAIALAGLVFAAVITSVSVIATAVLINADGGTLVWSADLLQVLLGATAAIVVYGLLGVALGALLQNQVAALVGSLIWLLAVEQLLMALYPAASRWTLAGATAAVVQLGRASTYNTRPSFLAGATLLITYTTLISTAAIIATTHRDLT